MTRLMTENHMKTGLNRADSAIVHASQQVFASVNVFRDCNLSSDALAIVEQIRRETLALLENFEANDDAAMDLTEKQNQY